MEISLSQLKIPDMHELIYGVEPYYDLKQSFRESISGAKIYINKKNEIISGVRQFRALKDLGHKKISVIIKDFPSQQAEIEFILKENRYRTKTNYQKIREGIQLEPYERIKAKHRQKSGTQVRTNLDEPKGKTTQIVAELVGLKKTSYEKGKKVINKIDDFIKKKKYKCADKLIELLNNSIDYAQKLINEENEVVMTYLTGDYKKIFPAKLQAHFDNRIDIANKGLIKETVLYKKNKYYLGNSIDVLKIIPKETVDCVITDPPYGVNYKSRNIYKNYNDNPEYAFSILNSVCKELKRVCKPNAHLYFFFAMSNYLKTKNILEKYFKVNSIPLIWHKTEIPKIDSSSYGIYYEPIFYCFNQNNQRKLKYGLRGSVYKFTGKRNKTHSSEKPVDLLKEIIRNSTVEKETVLDCFAGSGNTLIAAKNLNRYFIGIELDKTNWQLSEVPQKYKVIHKLIRGKGLRIDKQRYSLYKKLIPYIYLEPKETPAVVFNFDKIRTVVLN